MSFASFAVMPPAATMSMIDNSRWRTVVYADTPKSLARYKEYITNPKSDGRKVVVFVFGVSALREVLKNQDKFNSVFVFDDLQNLSELRTQMNVQIVDAEEKPTGVFPKYLTPQELAALADAPMEVPDNFFLKKVTSALGNRRPSVLETTNRLPAPFEIEASGIQRVLSDIKLGLPEDAFSPLLNGYCKYLFGMVDRNFITQTITKKLPVEVKELWKKCLDYADSEVGSSMKKAYAKLCPSKDPDYRAGHAVVDFNLRPYSGDFLYLTAIFPPLESAVFLSESTTEPEQSEVVRNTSWKAPVEPEPAVKSKRKRSKSTT